MTGRIRSLWNDKALVHRATITFVFASIVAVIFRYCFYDARDPSKCGALLNDGVWIDAPSALSTATPKQWQPPGCMVHAYKPKEVSSCLSNRRLVFVGDSTIRQVFWATAKKLDPKIEMKGDKHSDITVDLANVKLEFTWDPFLNGSVAIKELGLLDRKASNRPALMLMGTGLWYARFVPTNPLKQWKDSINGVVQYMDGRRNTDLTHQDFALLAPVPVPVWDKLNDDRRATIRPDTIAEMNEYMHELSDIHGIDVAWAFNKMTAGIPQVYENSGIHVLDSIAAKQAETLLNLRCNAELPPKYPYDRTCCNKYEAPNWQQWALLVSVLAVLPVLSYMRTKAENNNTKAPEWLPSENTLSALIIFGFALVFCFYADRTQVFNKFHKSYTNSSFLSLIFATIAVGLLTLKKSSETATDQPFLFRDQTDEWKGWMQFAILVYHYTGGSKVAWIYGFIRVTVASYLFMTGYGHTFYFYKKGDYSFKRVAGVMLRLNLLSCALPYIMKTDYLFYYFAPLVTWWYFIVYFTMRIGKKYNVNTRFLVGKILFSALFTTAITKISGILEAVFGVINFVCRTNWNVQEWRFRVALDMWIVYVGMLVAIAYIKLSDTSNPYHRLVADYRSKVIPASAVSVVLFLMFQTTRETKFVYNAYHPYISWIPILGFIILRNATPNLRNTYSGAFAWIGKCSLETFTLQFHIWLAADTRGILDFGIFGPYAWWSNLAISSFVFLYTCDNVSAATGGLTAWIMSAPPRRPPVPRQPQQEQGEQLSVLPTTNPAATSSAEAAQPVEPKPAPSSRPQQQDAAPEKWWSGLKARCAGILLALWVLNITYTS